jgi:taurine dioxygenase
MQIAPYTEIEVRLTGKPVGAELVGVDLSRELDDATFRSVKGALDENGMIYFRDQKLAPEAQLAFSRRFGELIRHVRQEYALPGYPEIHLISNVKENSRSIGSAYAGDDWHTDLCFTKYPCHYAMLYAVEVPVQDGRVLGDTEFASTAFAYDTLDADMKRRLRDKRAIFQYHRAQARKQRQRAHDHARPDLTPEQKAATPDVVHDAVITHPVNGRKCLYVNRVYTFGIEGMSEEEAQPFLEKLFAHIIRPATIYRHSWRVGDVVMWDNYQTQHMAIGDYALPLRRLMHRTAVKGTAALGAV